LKLTWQDVFDSNKRFWDFRPYAQNFAREAGYKYFVWNNKILSVIDCKEIGTIEELIVDKL
jgi:hypothetical protein